MTFFILMLMGMPVAFAIGISGMIFFLQQPTLPLTIPVQLVLTQTQSFVLLAIPLFMFAGNLLNESGITYRLMKLSSVLAGHMRAGVAQVNTVLAAMMGGITGSAIADATMQSRVLGPGMLERGYSRGFAAGVIGFNSLIVTMIPPGIVQQMKKQGGGVIVNVASVAALKGIPDRSAYSASKGAVVALSKAMAADYIKDNIRVNVVCPGTTDTPSLEERMQASPDPAATRAAFIARQPMGRLGKAEEIAHAILFACCDEAAFMNGSVITIDGGATI
nr:SDR family oxidoreductase [Sporolituus thermophilus]